HQHQIEEEEVGADDWEVEARRGTQRSQIIDDLAGRHPDTQRRDRKVMAAQPQQWDGHDEREERGDEGRDQECEAKRPVEVAREHADGVRAQAEEGNVPKTGVSGEAANDVPGRGQHDEHRHGGGDSEPHLVCQQRQPCLLGGIDRRQRSQNHVGEPYGCDGHRRAAHPPRKTPCSCDHASRPRSPRGRTTSTTTSTTNAIAFAYPELSPGALWPSTSMRPKASPPTTVALTRPRPPRITTANACRV